MPANLSGDCRHRRFKRARTALRFLAGPAIAVLLSCSAPGSNTPDISIEAQVAEDQGADWDFEDILIGSRDAEFRPLVQPSENFGANRSAYWVRVEIQSDVRPLLLEVDYAALPSVEFYLPEPVTDIFVAEQYRLVRTGREIAFGERPLPTLTHVVRIEDVIRSPVYIRIQSSYTVIGVRAFTIDAFEKKQSTENVVFGMYYGLILGIVAYNLFVWLSARDRSFLFYVLFILSLSAQQAVFFGLAFRFFWPDSPLIEDRAYSVFTAAANIFGLSFAYAFLNIREKVSELSLAFRIAIAASAVLLVAGVIVPRADLLQILRFVALFSALMIFVGIILGMRRGVREARFFLIASGFTTLAVIVFVIPMFRIVPSGFLTRHALLVSSAVDALLLSLALADRINILRGEKSDALDRERRLNDDRRMLLDVTKSLSTSEDAPAAVRIVLDHLFLWRPQLFSGVVSVWLSAGLSERGGVRSFIRASAPATGFALAPLRETSDGKSEANLQRALAAGSSALIVGRREDPLAVFEFESQPHLDSRERVHMQSVLHSLSLRLQAIRSATESTLATVAGFAAGVVHDLKNDVTAVQYFLEAMASNPSDDIKTSMLRDAKDSLDDMLGKVHGALDFMRGERELDLKDIEAAVFGELLESRLRPIFAAKQQELDIRIDYAGPIRLDARRMIRAIANIAHNAAGAMRVGGRFAVGVARSHGELLIRMQDSGSGIPESVRDRLFVPFGATTGRSRGGYGLGLAITRSIVEEHAGTVDWEREPDAGAVFVIRLPLASRRSD
ncbi:MAG: sensor histidine kinase [bacterium]|nr:sensor histidine kinase [bacterium]